MYDVCGGPRRTAAEVADEDRVGDVIYLSERLADRPRASVAPAAFFYALDCPVSYLAAEWVQRAQCDVIWIPVVGPLSESSGLRSADERRRLADERLALAGREARLLSVPLIAPRRYPVDSRRAARTAIWAAQKGRGAGFALGVARLAFREGFDIGSDHVIVDAAIGAGLDPAQALEASHDPGWDRQLDATSRGLKDRGILMPPVVRVASRWFCGSDAMTAAVSFGAGHARESAPYLPVS
jgi:2-hydroxychromene-2-carboxylate isomerase